MLTLPEPNRILICAAPALLSNTADAGSQHKQAFRSWVAAVLSTETLKAPEPKQ
jgi:hypothetical protein